VASSQGTKRSHKALNLLQLLLQPHASGHGMALFRLAGRCATRVNPGFAAPSLRGRCPPSTTTSFLGAVRGMSSNPDPYKTLNVPRDASDAEIKKAYRTKAMTTHPDRNPELDPVEAQRRFAEVGNAFELLKDPSAREEFDMTGRVGGGGGGGGGQPGMDMREMMLREMMRRQMRQRPPPPPPKIFPEAEMEAYISSDVASIHRASRECKIDTDRDERRAAYAGKLGVVASVDPDDRTVKVRVMVSPGKADEVWFGAGALWDPRLLEEGLEVRVCPDEQFTHRASRAVGIDEENDGRRARCAGKLGTILALDQVDHTAKVRVIVGPRNADELWFGIAALEPVAQKQ
jgi:curved DNA-binding protein CbpA